MAKPLAGKKWFDALGRSDKSRGVPRHRNCVLRRMGREAGGAGMKTGWPPGLLQDDCRALFRWFANRIDARWACRKAIYG